MTMKTSSLDSQRARLALRLGRLSAEAWVHEVDLLAQYDSVSLDEALTLLGRRFAGEYLASRRHIVWPMLEYAFIRLDSSAWAHPLRHPSGGAREERGAAA